VFARAGIPDGEVVVGARPEVLRLVGPDDAGPGFAVSVEVVEPLGDEVLVHGWVQARDAGVRIETEEATLLAAEADRGAPVTVRLDPQVRPKPGETVHVAVTVTDLHVFDGPSGQAIR
jgi:ABC-type sugar transport system ATPase subunit